MTATDELSVDEWPAEDRASLVDMAWAMAPVVWRHDRVLAATLDRAADLTDDQLTAAVAAGARIALPILRQVLDVAMAQARQVVATSRQVLDQLGPPGLLELDECEEVIDGG